MDSDTKLMTKAATFDTLSASKDLQGAGFDRKQAEALARTMARVQRNMATKEDIANLRADIANLREENKKDIDRLHTTMYRVFLPIYLLILGFMLQSYFTG